MRLLVPAKINLNLRVGPPRPDGFHPLLSWFCTAGLFDTLTLDAANNGLSAGSDPGEPGVTLSCDQPDLPCDERNLVVRVAAAWWRECRAVKDHRIAPTHMKLQKRIPSGAGLGGGSSDGAHALMAVNRLWNTQAADKRLAEFSGRFGSDLPFFFYGPSSVCAGRGEIVNPIGYPRPRWGVLILPEIAMPTPAVYRQFDAMKLGRIEDVENQPDWNAWTGLDSLPLLGRLVNDLEPAAFAIAPELGALRAAIEQTAGRPVRMSGSGSSLFTLFDSREESARLAGLIEARHATRALSIEIAPIKIDESNVGDV